MIINFKINHNNCNLFQPINNNIYSFFSDEKGPFKVCLEHKGNIICEKELDKNEIKGFKLCNLEYNCEYCILIDNKKIVSFKTALLLQNSFITTKDEINNPIFYRSFDAKKEIESAFIAITGLGLYECSINGKKVGNSFLTPGFNDYDLYLRYKTYDITSLIQNNNIIELEMANGWYKGRFGLESNNLNESKIWGEKYLLNLKIILNYIDGTKEEIVSDKNFKCKTSSLEKSGIYDGEFRNYCAKIKKDYDVIEIDKKYNLIPDFIPSIVAKEKISPELLISKKGEKILDFKQNMVGFVKINKKLNKGEKIKLSFGEILQDDCFFNKNYRTANPVFEVIGDGIKKEFAPKFTYYGFRYAKVEGLCDVNPKDFEGVVLYTDLNETLKCLTDNPKINRLIQNALWGQKGNFLDIPTDCPQRDERLGWTGDAQVFSKSGMYQMDCINFYNKYLYDLRLEQKYYFNGEIPMYVPSLRKRTGLAGAVWSDAAIIIPWNIYMFTGDKETLNKHYELMQDYVDSLIRKDETQGGKGLILYGFTFGDWLALDGVCQNARAGGTDNGFIMSIYYYNALKIMCEVCDILNKVEELEKYKNIKNKVFEAILDEFFAPNGRLCLDTQTAYLLSLHFGVYRDKKVIASQLKKRLAKDMFKLKTGFVGTPLLLPVLLENNMVNDAYRILYNEECPGWLYEVNMGATTIWERWNSLLPNGKISGIDMNSFNHYSFGAVVEGIYSNIAGLKPLKPGFEEVLIEPKLNYRLKKLNFAYDAFVGKFEINYEFIDKMLVLSLIIPKGCKAHLNILNLTKELKAGSYEFKLYLYDDLLYKYNLETPMIDYLNDEKALKILHDYFPECYNRIMGESKEYLILSIKELSFNPLMKITAKNLKKFELALKEISIYE